MKNLKIDADRLWASLMEMAEIGATEKGGVCRLALTDLDRAGRDLFVRWCEEAGCTVNVDRLGNIFARRPGRDETRPPVMAGSHLDSQPTGGKFDGAYGVLAGLEVVRTLNDFGIETDAPVEVAAWTNEEGSRFSPPMMGSGAFAGVFGEEDAARAAGQRHRRAAGRRAEDASAMTAPPRSAGARSAPISRPISSRARSWRTKQRPSASSPAPRASAGTRSP